MKSRALAGQAATRSLRPSSCRGRCGPPTIQASTVVADDLESRVRALREGPGKDIWLFGGGDLCRSLIDLGLVDTVEVGIMPVLLGQGVPVVQPLAEPAKLKLTRHQIYPKSGRRRARIRSYSARLRAQGSRLEARTASGSRLAMASVLGVGRNVGLPAAAFAKADGTP